MSLLGGKEYFAYPYIEKDNVTYQMWRWYLYLAEREALFELDEDEKQSLRNWARNRDMDLRREQHRYDEPMVGGEVLLEFLRSGEIGEPELACKSAGYLTEGIYEVLARKMGGVEARNHPDVVAGVKLMLEFYQKIGEGQL